MCLRAGRAVGHPVFAVDVGVLRRGDLHLVDGHGVVVRAGHRWGIVEVTGDALALEAAFAHDITLVGGVAAAESREVVAAVGAERSWVEASPVIAALLRWRAVVVGVAWAAV